MARRCAGFTFVHQLANISGACGVFCLKSPLTASRGTLLIMSLFLSRCWLCADKVDVYMEPPKFLLKSVSQSLVSGSVLREARHAAWLPSCRPSPALSDANQVGSRLPYFSWQPAFKEMPLRG